MIQGFVIICIRQELSDPTETNVPCDELDCFYGYQGDGYIGRDMGDPSGIPNDQSIRTVFGVYPAAGLYDNDQSNPAFISSNSGAGIHPMLTSFMTHFIIAEAALTLGTTGDARASFETAMEHNFDKITQFGIATDPMNAPAVTDSTLMG